MASEENSPTPSTENKQCQSMGDKDRPEKEPETHCRSYESGNDGNSRQSGPGEGANTPTPAKKT